VVCVEEAGVDDTAPDVEDAAGNVVFVTTGGSVVSKKVWGPNVVSNDEVEGEGGGVDVALLGKVEEIDGSVVFASTGGSVVSCPHREVDLPGAGVVVKAGVVPAVVVTDVVPDAAAVVIEAVVSADCDVTAVVSCPHHEVDVPAAGVVVKAGVVPSVVVTNVVTVVAIVAGSVVSAPPAVVDDGATVVESDLVVCIGEVEVRGAGVDVAPLGKVEAIDGSVVLATTGGNVFSCPHHEVDIPGTVVVMKVGVVPDIVVTDVITDAAAVVIDAVVSGEGDVTAVV